MSSPWALSTGAVTPRAAGHERMGGWCPEDLGVDAPAAHTPGPAGDIEVAAGVLDSARGAAFATRCTGRPGWTHPPAVRRTGRRRCQRGSRHAGRGRLASAGQGLGPRPSMTWLRLTASAPPPSLGTGELRLVSAGSPGRNDDHAVVEEPRNHLRASRGLDSRHGIPSEQLTAPPGHEVAPAGSATRAAGSLRGPVGARPLDTGEPPGTGAARSSSSAGRLSPAGRGLSRADPADGRRPPPWPDSALRRMRPPPTPRSCRPG